MPGISLSIVRRIGASIEQRQRAAHRTPDRPLGGAERTLHEWVRRLERRPTNLRRPTARQIEEPSHEPAQKRETPDI